ncbi:nck-associated protein 5-like isoform X2 [Notolabrus celidotus]|nr:nck-associated protein 5-like isoform X2 [Notolabrus celidotus]XP_034550863.1 nck-associated protein 5-like isoform X2 [Notolabrus celidotus]XP_034550864.1 nck-associated protein 5-like isoform X2 [Notolabrus celidotus]XP_034550865.1 nck-associated protein 5-like isoform X2 [Notolabrus celidotus]
MRTMSDETEQRMCEEDFGTDEEGEEADVESYLEDNSSELMDRLKELEAENSALLLANESQREAYERCLDEVANHVVQALLNQKDLREECIKLKMLVFDLERQNRALCELFQQKLPNHPTAHYQVQAGPLPDYNAQLHNDSAKQVESAQTEAQAKGNGYRTQHASPGPRGPAASMEALSPFFKKKAHILEVLRKMEETDPLKFHPSTTSLSFCDYSQVLMSTEAVLAAAEPLPLQPLHTHCHCSRPDADTHQHVNGDGAVKCEAGNTCCLHCKRSPEGPPKPCNHVCSTSKANSASQSHVVPAAATSECHSKSRTAEAAPVSKQCTKNEVHQQPAGAAHPSVSADPSLQGLEEPESSESFLNDSASEEITGFSSVKDSKQIAHCDTEDSEGIQNGVALMSDPSAIPEKDIPDQEASSVRAGASVSPSPSCLSDVKAAAINSPSKLLKFLKIPSIGEKAQASTSAVRLSPQLTRSSRIPCRTNNYEVYHSPVPTRRATTTERCRQPPPPPSRSESYPATHSAPTSPPQPEEEVCPAPVKDISYSSLSAPKAASKMVPPSSSSTSSSSPKVSQRIPHYENVCNMSREEEPAQSLEKRTMLPSQMKANGGERKLVKSLPESVLNPHPQRKQSSSSTSESTSDDEEDSDSPVWVNHHSLPSSSALGKAQGRAIYAQPREKPEADVTVQSSEAPQPPPPPVRRGDSSIPKRPASGAGRLSQADSSHHAFKDRLAALSKLRSSEDLQVGLRPVEHVNEGTYVEERTKTAERPMELHKEEQRHSKYTDSLDSKPKGVGLKYPGSSQMYEQAVKSQPKQELLVTKPEGPKSKIGLPSPNADAPQVLRNNIKCPGSLNLAYNLKQTPHSSSSPNKIPPKSPSKPCQPPSVHRASKPTETPRYSSKSEERTKISGKGKKNPMYGDSLPPPPPRPPASDAEKQPIPPAPSPQSAIEQKVMKGIEENLLKLQEQDRGLQGGEVKQKASNGIASWFGLKKSKLPALSRKTDGTKAKDEKKEWKINIPSVGRDSVKMATRCKEGVEGLNISTLMEKAEGLRRALEEERAYVERSGRGHSCEVVMDQAQGQLAVMYRGARSDNFMQQLLNRVDGKEVISVPQRRLSFDCKTSKPMFGQQSDVISHTSSRDDMEKGSDRIGKITSDENLADSVHLQQHFAGSGASTYTLDSGIGTFPLPDCSSGAAGRGLSKTRVGADHHSSGSPGRAGRRARTLERDLTSQEECYTPHKQLIPTIQYGSVMEGRGSAGVIREDKEAHGANMFSPRSKTWTFPNLKTPAGPAEVYLAVEEEEEEPVSFGSPFRGGMKAGGPSSSRVVDPGSLPVPAQTGMSRRGKTRTPSVPEMSREAGLELLRERPEEAISPSRPQVLETPESLSDSLYDSLSSCGSQG